MNTQVKKVCFIVLQSHTNELSAKDELVDLVSTLNYSVYWVVEKVTVIESDDGLEQASGGLWWED